MLISALIGLIAAGVVAVPAYLYINFPSIPWYSPVFVLGVGAVALLLQKFVFNRGVGDQNYQGLSDLMAQIHLPSKMDWGLRWFLRGWVSFLLSLFGGIAGSEGAAIEWSQAFTSRVRNRSSRWFEQRRRTDIASSLAAGVSAAFGAPFAAVVLPMELGVGGKSILSVVSALFAWVGIRFLSDQFSLRVFDSRGIIFIFHFTIWKEWLGVILIGLISGLVGAGSIRFIRYTQESLLSLFQTQAWIRVLAGAVLLYLIFYIVKTSHFPSFILLEQIFWGKYSVQEASFLFVTGLLSLALLLSGFGTLGIFWPLFSLGGYLGFCVHHWLFAGWMDIVPMITLIGSVAFLAAILGVPLTGALLALEITQNIQVFLPCLLGGWIAQMCRQALRTQTLSDEDLKSRDLLLVNGKSAAILDSITVREAMVTDYEAVHEQEPVSELQAKLLKSPYPFLPVINTQGLFSGLLTVDMLKEGWDLQRGDSTQFSLERLLEAKDVLYKSGFKSSHVKVTDRLSKVVKLFDQSPCIPVLGEDGRVFGLLFVYHVRLAYERELAKRSFIFMRYEG